MMLRVTSWIERLWKSSDDEFAAWCEEMNIEYPRNKPLTPERILKWASNFGTIMHGWCLEGRAPKTPSRAMISCYDHWKKFLEDNDIKLLRVERKVIFNDLYHGTYDAIVEWNGMKVLLDLKFWQCWYWALFKEKIPTELKLNSTKLAKANFQTYCYDRAQHDYETDARCVVAINPLGLQYKIFTTSPKKKFEEELKNLVDNQLYNF